MNVPDSSAQIHTPAPDQPTMKSRACVGVLTVVLSLGLATGLGLAAITLMLLALGAGTAQASHPGGLQIGLAGTSTFFMDSNGFCSPPGSIDGPDGVWLPVVVTNTTASETYTGLEITLSRPVNTVVDDPVRYLGTLGPGQTTTVFFFLDYRQLRTLPNCSDGIDGWYAQPYTLRITSVSGSLTGPAVFTDTFDSLSMISANAGGARFSDFLGPGVAVGQLFTQVVDYIFGNNPANSQLFLQPTGNGNFNDQCYRLVGSRIVSSQVAGVIPGAVNTLFFPSTDTANADHIAIEYQWFVLCSPGGTTQAFAWAEITSGTQFKYNAGGYTPNIFPLPVPATNIVSITKSVSPPVLPAGGVATYTVQFANAFTQPVYLSVVTDTPAAGVVYQGVVNGLSDISATNSSLSPTVPATGILVWYGIPLPSLSASYRIPASSSIYLIYTATVPSTPGLYTNAVTGQVGNIVFGPTTATVTVGTANLSIAKSDFPDPVIAGNTLTYTLVIANAGPAPAANVIVTDTLPAGVTLLSATPSQGSCVGAVVCNLGTLPAGGTSTITIRAMVNPGTTGTLTNTAIVGSSTPELDPTDNSSTITTTVTTQADLSLVKVANVPTVTVGSALVYTIIVNNAGPSVATNVSVSETLPAQLTFVSATANPGIYDNLAGVWTIPTIPSGSNATLVITSTVNSAGAFTNTAQVAASDQPDPDSTPGNSNPGEDDQDSVPIPSQVADLSLAKSASPASVDVGQNVTFTIVITNSGPDAATGVEVSDVLPSGLGFVTATASQGSYSSVSSVWTVGTLASGVTATLTIVATVNTTGAITNTAQVSDVDQFDPDSIPGNGNPGEDDQGGTTVIVQQADLNIIKSGPATVTAGGLLTYTLVIANAGPSGAQNVMVTDALPAGVALVSATPSQGSCVGAVVCSLGTLPSGGTANIIIVVTVNPGTTGVLTNTATVGSSTPDPNPGDNSDTELTTSLVPGLQLDKQVTPGEVTRGQPIIYTIRITNTGQTTFNPLTLTDTLPTAFFYVTGTGSPSDPDTIAPPLLVWNNLGPLAPGQGIAVTFIVTASPALTGTYTNVATGAGVTPGGTLTGTDDAPIVLTDPRVDVDKQLIAADTDLAAPNFVTFTIRITNTGPSVINVLPLLDSYDPTNLSFVSATPMPDEPIDDGQVAWYDLTAPPPNGFNANLPPGQSFLITTTFRVVQDITTTVNTASVTNALDVFNNQASDVSASVVVNNIPTAVELIYFRVEGVSGPQVTLAWATAAEIDNFGFTLYRAPVNDFAQAEFIHFEPSALLGGSGTGATYRYTDSVPSNGEWWYWLADVDTRGRETRHGPVTTAVGVASPQNFRLYLPILIQR